MPKNYRIAIHDRVVAIDVKKRTLTFTPNWAVSNHCGYHAIAFHALDTLNFGIAYKTGITNAHITWGQYSMVDGVEVFNSHRYFDVNVDQYKPATKNKHQLITLRAIGYGFDTEVDVGMGGLPVIDLQDEKTMSMDFATFIESFGRDAERIPTIPIRGLCVTYTTNEKEY